jgi:hypothetical protein
MGKAVRKPAVWIENVLIRVCWIGYKVFGWRGDVFLGVDLLHTPTVNHIISFRTIVGEHDFHRSVESEGDEFMLSDQPGLHLLVFLQERFYNREEGLFTLLVSLNTGNRLTASRLTFSGTEVDKIIDQNLCMGLLRVKESGRSMNWVCEVEEMILFYSSCPT